MNDSLYGLTASVWTNAEENPESESAFLKFVDELETGTVFLNRQGILISLQHTRIYCCSTRCDYLDPALAWTGVKDSGRGVSLSKFGEYYFSVMLGSVFDMLPGYDQLTRAKSIHMKIRTS
jgi:acyl-CoA reductase-like NAD-dependent aldehyde dehydrogenase